MAKNFDFSQLKKAEDQRKKDFSEDINIVIFDDFKNLIPPLSQEEYEELEKSILAEGCRESLILWKNEDRYILIDGHNRYEICQKHQIGFQTIIKEFENEAEVKAWMFNNQLGRRNLNVLQASYLRGLKYENDKQIGFRQSVGNEQTAEKVAFEFKVSYRTIERDAQFAKGIDLIGKENPELKMQILSGKVKINKNQIQALAKLESLPKIESLDQIADILQAEKPAKEQVKTDLEMTKEKLIKLLKEQKLTLEVMFEIERNVNLLKLQLEK